MIAGCWLLHAFCLHANGHFVTCFYMPIVMGSGRFHVEAQPPCYLPSPILAQTYGIQWNTP